MKKEIITLAHSETNTTLEHSYPFIQRPHPGKYFFNVKFGIPDLLKGFLSNHYPAKGEEKNESDMSHYLRTIPNHIHDGIVIVNQNGKVVFINEPMLKLAQLKEEEIMGEKWNNILQLFHTCEINPQNHPEENHLYCTCFTMSKEEKVYVEINAYQLHNEKRNNGWMYVITNITPLQNQSERLAKTMQKAQTAKKLQQAFLSNMSHEFRTPLNAIIGLSNLLKDKGDLSGEECCNFLNIIEEKGYELLEILTDLIEIARLKSNDVRLNPSSFDMNQFIEECCIRFKQQMVINDQPLQITMKLPKAQSEFLVNTDDYYLNQVMKYLLESVHHYSFSGDLEVGYEVKNNSPEIFICDKASYIPPQESKHLFEHFWFGEEYHSRNVGKNGIKMNICGEIVKLLGGRIRMESEKGIGTSFKFSIANKLNQ